MKKMSIICLILASLLAACTPYMYGVPQETWDRMSEPERIEAIRVYEREQQARRQAAEERARRQAVERERERARQAALERERRERIEAIHRGEGAYGELIRVRLQGGKIRIGDRYHRYEPLTFTIADGETRKIVADRKGREVELTVTYAGGALNLEGLRFPYDRRWGKGALYTDTATSGPLALQRVDVFIEVHHRSSRFERELPRLVIREEPPVVIRENEPPRPPPPVRQPVPPVAEPHVKASSASLNLNKGRTFPWVSSARTLPWNDARSAIPMPPTSLTLSRRWTGDKTACLRLPG